MISQLPDPNSNKKFVIKWVELSTDNGGFTKTKVQIREHLVQLDNHFLPLTDTKKGFLLSQDLGLINCEKYKWINNKSQFAIASFLFKHGLPYFRFWFADIVKDNYFHIYLWQTT